MILKISKCKKNREKKDTTSMGDGHIKMGNYKRLFEEEINTAPLEWAMTALE